MVFATFSHAQLHQNMNKSHQHNNNNICSTYLSLSLLSLCLFVVISFTFIRTFVKHQYHSKIDDQIDKALASMTQGLINKLVSVLEGVLSKLSRYDEGSLIGSFLSFTVSASPPTFVVQKS